METVPNSEDGTMHVLVYDIKLMRPGCALLQAAMGGTVPATLFPSECWLLAPTPDMKAYRINRDDLDRVVAFHSKRGHGKTNS